MGTFTTFRQLLIGALGLTLIGALAGPLTAPPTLLPVDIAFRPKVTLEGKWVHVEFMISPDCYLYRERMRAEGPDHQALPMMLPAGLEQEDEVLGGTHEIYRDHVEWTIPVASDTSSVKLTWQGCAEKAGVCYPAQRRVFSFK